MPLKPFDNIDSIQRIEKPGLSKFNGDYEILSADTNFCTLGYALVYSEFFDFKRRPTKDDYINIKAIDDRHIKATLIVKGKRKKTNTIKGRLIDNYFEFYTNHLRFWFILNAYQQQHNRISLSKDGALYLDTNRGVIGFLVIMPIPLSGSSFDTYNLKFNRSNKSN